MCLGPEVLLWAEVGNQGGWHGCGIYWVCKMGENYTDLGATLLTVSAGSGLGMWLTTLQPVPKPVHVQGARVGDLPVQWFLFLLRALISHAQVAAHCSSAQLS